MIAEEVWRTHPVGSVAGSEVIVTLLPERVTKTLTDVGWATGGSLKSQWAMRPVTELGAAPPARECDLGRGHGPAVNRDVVEQTTHTIVGDAGATTKDQVGEVGGATGCHHLEEQLAVDVDALGGAVLDEHEVVPVLPPRGVAAVAGVLVDVLADAREIGVAATGRVEVDGRITPRQVGLEAAGAVVAGGRVGPEGRAGADRVVLRPDGERERIARGEMRKAASMTLTVPTAAPKSIE